MAAERVVSRAELQARIERAMSEDELLTFTLAVARLHRWRVYHVRNSKAGIVQGDPGFPDLVLLRPPRLLFVELKRQIGRLSDEQHAWHGLLDQLPLVELYVWRPSDRDRIIELLA